MANNEVRFGEWVDERLATLSPGDDWKPDPTASLSRLRGRRKSRSARGRHWIWAATASTAAGVCLGART